MAREKNDYVQYGCGWSAPVGWRNFDASPTLRFERIPLVGKLYTKNQARFPPNVEYGDIVKGLPIPDGSCSAIYCSHVLEHLSLTDLRAALRNTCRSLADDGIFRLVLPDLKFYIRRYLDDPTETAAMSFLQDTSLGQENRSRGLSGLVTSWLGNSQHLWMWDYRSIRLELRSAGFRHIRRAIFDDSSDETFKEVEELIRWTDCLGVECKK